jgi:WD40 repeat protein
MVGGYHELTVWNPEDGTLVRRIKNMAARTYALAFSPDGTKLAVACGSPGRRGEVRLLDAATGNLLTVLAPSGDVVLDAAFSPDGSRIAAVGAEGVLRVFHVETSAAQVAAPAHADWVTVVAWSGDGQLLATASRDKSAKVFDAASGEPRVTYAGHEQVVSGVIFHPDGQQVYSGGADNKVHLWSVADGKKTADIPGAGGEACKLVRGGAFLFAAAADRSVRQLDLGTRAQVRAFSGHGETVLSIAVHEGVKRVAAGAFDGTIRVWNLEDGKQISQFTAAPGYASRR